MLTSCGKDSTGVELGGVASVAVSPAADSVYIGSSITLTATPEDADGNALSGREIFWHSEHPEIAVVSGEGVVTGIVPGEVRIAASVEGVPGYSTVTVLPKPPASLTLSSSSLSLTVGQESRLQATVKDGDGGVLTDAPVDWKSSNTAVATVDADGLVHGVGAGTATITATSGSVKDEATVTVSPVPANAVVVSPGEATLFVGETVTLKATVTDANGDPLSGRPITWSSSATSVATVSTSGVVTAKAPGTATITAASEGKSGKSTITVKLVPVASVDMNPGELKLQIGQSSTITATPKASDGTPLTGRSISWKSRDPGIATVSGSGEVTAKAAGSTIIEATSEGVTGVTLVQVAAIPVSSVVVTPDTATLVVGASKQLTAKTYDAGGTELSGRTITWSSSNEDVASVSSSGKVLAVAPGSATITATSEGKSDKATITVVAPVSSVVVSPDSISVIVGKTSTLTATVKDASGNTLTGRDVTWKSDNTGVATVDANGVVTGVSAGTTTVTATSGGKSGSAKVVVTLEPVARVTVVDLAHPESPPSVVQGQTLQLAALLADADGNALLDRVVTWASADASIASVDDKGLVTGLKVGQTKITATSEGVSGSADVTVTSALAEGSVIIVPAETTLVVLQSADLKGLVVNKDGQAKEDKDLTWSSDNALIAAVNDHGRVQALVPGSATITAAKTTKSGDVQGTPGTAKVTVVAPES
ncbi:MAG TPA: Ig-like domain-containing protein [Gemmatimonadaceae bacterium]|nr:Ig-like domain-containing protein [Gemmatimonadaceae bacterium]